MCVVHTFDIIWRQMIKYLDYFYGKNQQLGALNMRNELTHIVIIYIEKSHIII